MLINYLLPKFNDVFIFSKMAAGVLNKIYVLVRKTGRIILHLARDLPKAAFHAKVADGGLGVPSFRYTIPLIANKRLLFSSTIRLFVLYRQ